MKNLKYKNVELQYKPNTGDMINAENSTKRKEIFTSLYQFLLILFSTFGLPSIICIVVSCVFKKDTAEPSVFLTYVAIWLIYYMSLAILCGCLKALAYRQSQKRLAYLPLTAEECEKLKITNVEEYCEFLNNFLRVTPTGKKAEGKSVLWNVAEMSPEIRNKVENSVCEIFSETFHIRFDDEIKTYYVPFV